MFSRFLRQVVVRPNTISSVPRNVRLVPATLPGSFLHSYGVAPARLFSEASEVSKVSRNVKRFAPILNTFATQYLMADNKEAVLQDLAAKSSKCGFESLEQATLGYLKEPSDQTSINLYSVLLISAIQIKDDTLLSYLLEDASKYFTVNNDSMYEVLKRICHYRRYAQFVHFLSSYIETHPEATSSKSFLEISLYLVSKDDEDDSELASQLWKSLQQFVPQTEEECHQRRIDLSHALSVSIRCDDWETSYDYLKNAHCDVSHVAQVLRGIAQSESVDLKRLSALYKENRPIIFRMNDASVTKDVFFVIDLMLDVCSLGGDSSLLSTIVNDLLGKEETSHPVIPITNKLYSRLVRLCIENNLPQCVFALYTWPDESFHSMIRVYRAMERYFRALKSSDPAMMQLKQQVLQLHLSNPSSEEAIPEKDEDSVVEEFIEPSVLEVLKDFNPQEANERGTRKKRSESKKPMRESDMYRRGRSDGSKRGNADAKRGNADAKRGNTDMRSETKGDRPHSRRSSSRDESSRRKGRSRESYSRRTNSTERNHFSGRSSRRNASRERRSS